MPINTESSNVATKISEKTVLDFLNFRSPNGLGLLNFFTNPTIRVRKATIHNSAQNVKISVEPKVGYAFHFIVQEPNGTEHRILFQKKGKEYIAKEVMNKSQKALHSLYYHLRKTFPRFGS